jgi:hypothetical protein
LRLNSASLGEGLKSDSQGCPSQEGSDRAVEKGLILLLQWPSAIRRARAETVGERNPRCRKAAF